MFQRQSRSTVDEMLLVIYEPMAMVLKTLRESLSHCKCLRGQDKGSDALPRIQKRVVIAVFFITMLGSPAETSTGLPAAPRAEQGDR